MTTDELRDAICKPAEQANLMVEPALVTEILNDIQGAPGSLPLLQYTLKELWQRRQESTLMLSAYQDLGGINGTLDKRATEIYNSFSDDQQRTVQHVFQQLTQLGEGTEDTRRRVFLNNLVSEPLHPAERVRGVINRLSDKENRLLITSEVVGKGEEKERRAIVDVAHESLIRQWRLLRQWIEKNRDLLRQQRRIEASAVIWQNNGHSKKNLLQGFQLNEALQFWKQQADTFPLSEPAKKFIQDSLWQKRWNLLKASIWLMIPALIITVPVEYFVRENDVERDYGYLGSTNKSQQKQAVQALVSGCSKSNSYSAVPRYFLERVFGNCRSLKRAKLSGADLGGAYLRSANLHNAYLQHTDLAYTDLREANLREAFFIFSNLIAADLRDAHLHHADLRNANMRSVNLRDANLAYTDLRDASLGFANLNNANLNNADLRNANLRNTLLSSTNLRNTDLRNTNLSNAYFRLAELHYADLSSADLSTAIFLATDLRTTKRLIQPQIKGEDSPFICNSPLPEGINISGDKDRDCDKLADILQERYPDWFESSEAAVNFVEKKQQKVWK